MSLFTQKAPGIMRSLMSDLNIGVLDAAAILGNIGHECGGFMIMQEKKPTVKGSRGGYGWAQWTGPRRVKFESWCKKRGLSPDSDQANYGYLVVELTTTESAALKAMRSKATLPEKVVAFEMNFERAGVKHYDSRQKYAEQALKAYSEKAPAPKPVPPPPDVEPVPEPAPVPWYKRLWIWISGTALGGSLGGGGVATGWDWHLFFAVAGSAVVIGMILFAIALWLFGKDNVAGWIKRKLS